MGVTPSSHPFIVWIFHEINHPAMGDTTISGNPHHTWLSHAHFANRLYL